MPITIGVVRIVTHFQGSALTGLHTQGAGRYRCIPRGGGGRRNLRDACMLGPTKGLWSERAHGSREESKLKSTMAGKVPTNQDAASARCNFKDWHQRRGAHANAKTDLFVLQRLLGNYFEFQGVTLTGLESRVVRFKCVSARTPPCGVVRKLKQIAPRPDNPAHWGASRNGYIPNNP